MTVMNTDFGEKLVSLKCGCFITNRSFNSCGSPESIHCNVIQFQRLNTVIIKSLIEPVPEEVQYNFNMG